MSWRQFRTDLDSMSFHDCVHEVNKYYWTAPLSSTYYSPDLPGEWPGPWDLITLNHYDDIARALGMLYTIALTRHDNHDLAIHCYRDRKNSRDYNLVWIDSGKYVLNYDLEVRVNNTLQLESASLIFSCSSNNLLGKNSNEHTDSSNKKKWHQRTT